MCLQSEEVVIKRRKSADIYEDFISRLPDVLLIRILSFLSAPDAYRTCILSKRWNNICTFPPNLHFVMDYGWSTEEVNMFYDSLDQTIALRGGLPIQRFSLSCFMNNLYNRVYDVLSKVGKIEEFDFRGLADKETVTFYRDLTETCSNLVSLTLSDVSVLHVPNGELLFPWLKKMVLELLYYSEDESISKLISGCPVLEELTSSKSVHYMNTFRVSSPSLKRLSLSYVFGHKIAIDAPKLEYLYIWDVIVKSISMTKPLSLIEAYIRTLKVAQFVKCFSSVKILTLDGLLLWDHDDYVLNMLVFPHLVKFVLGFKIRLTYQFLKLLDRMPNLKHIIFADGCLPCYSRHTRQEVPVCLHFKVKEIIIQTNRTITSEEFDLIRYMLKYSNNQETMVINADKIDATLRKQLMNSHCGSKSCRIQFV